MSEVLKVCHDRIAPSDVGRPERYGPRLEGPAGTLEAVIPDARQMWPSGSTLRIRFLDGTAAQQDQVRNFAPQWDDLTNLTFQFTDDPAAEIRVAFDSALGAWSYLGNRALQIPANEPTLNLGWVDEAVILHEFGHAVGLGHEHSNPQGGIEWNEEVVIRDLAGPPNFWDEAKVRHNVLTKYSNNHYLRGTSFDGASIMLYFFPDSWVKSGNGTSENLVLSDLDKAFIGGPAGYPKMTTDVQQIPVSDVSLVGGSIGAPGEEDLYLFDVMSEGWHVVETEGVTDVVMSLYGPNSQTSQIAEDDDGGAGSNARIAALLGAGTYYVQVRHYSTNSGTGPYDISVRRSVAA